MNRQSTVICHAAKTNQRYTHACKQNKRLGWQWEGVKGDGCESDVKTTYKNGKLIKQMFVNKKYITRSSGKRVPKNLQFKIKKLSKRYFLNQVENEHKGENNTKHHQPMDG